jgi:hypothetical protein
MKAKKKAKKAIQWSRLDWQGEFDEVFVSDASLVHIERMDERAFWIGINVGKRMLMINTGVSDGEWYFRIEEDKIGGKEFVVKRSAKLSDKAIERLQKERLEGGRNATRS